MNDFEKLSVIKPFGPSIGELIVKEEFVNDLITPHPEFGFPGLKDGDSWCVCAGWVARAIEAGKGCSVYLKRTHENTLKIVPFEKLKKLAIDLS